MNLSFQKKTLKCPAAKKFEMRREIVKLMEIMHQKELDRTKKMQSSAVWQLENQFSLLKQKYESLTQEAEEFKWRESFRENIEKGMLFVIFSLAGLIGYIVLHR